MKYLLLFFLISSIAMGGTCTSITRSDFVDGNVLSASDLNGQFSPAYAAINAADGGCVTDGTLELAALGTSEFSPQLKGIRKGCIVKETATSSFEISSCLATVGGINIDKSATTSVTYANLDTGSIATSTAYYIYIDSTSTGSTLVPQISVTAPDATGYNASNDLMLAKFHTNESSTELITGSTYQYGEKGYTHASRVTETTGIAADSSISFRLGGFIKSCTKASTGVTECLSHVNYAENFDSGAPKAHCWAAMADSSGPVVTNTAQSLVGAGQALISIYTYISTSGAATNEAVYLFCSVELKRN